MEVVADVFLGDKGAQKGVLPVAICLTAEDSGGVRDVGCLDWNVRLDADLVSTNKLFDCFPIFASLVDLTRRKEVVQVGQGFGLVPMLHRFVVLRLSLKLIAVSSAPSNLPKNLLLRKKLLPSGSQREVWLSVFDLAVRTQFEVDPETGRRGSRVSLLIVIFIIPLRCDPLALILCYRLVASVSLVK